MNTIVVTLATVLFAANVASAEMPLPGAEPLVTGTEGFEALDTDESGTVSLEEAEALESLHAAFADYDADENGVLDPSEYQAALEGGIRAGRE